MSSWGNLWLDEMLPETCWVDRHKLSIAIETVQKESYSLSDCSTALWKDHNLSKGVNFGENAEYIIYSSPLRRNISRDSEQRNVINGIKQRNQDKWRKARPFIPRAQRVESGGCRGRKWAMAGSAAVGGVQRGEQQRTRWWAVAMSVEHGLIPRAAMNGGESKRGRTGRRKGVWPTDDAWAACCYDHASVGSERGRERQGEHWLARTEWPASWKLNAAIIRPREGRPRRTGHIGAGISPKGREGAALIRAGGGHCRPQASRRRAGGTPTRIERRSGADDGERRRHTTDDFGDDSVGFMRGEGWSEVSGKAHGQGSFYAGQREEHLRVERIFQYSFEKEGPERSPRSGEEPARWKGEEDDLIVTSVNKLPDLGGRKSFVHGPSTAACAEAAVGAEVADLWVKRLVSLSAWPLFCLVRARTSTAK
ncbi:hypothetical protein B0H11DRAFT_1898516 [Mycena galericulata]|nr:hypothetical protein B0H11DRAFT_1898516 [Mycena galericulata]